jgi:hypothetical protein
MRITFCEMRLFNDVSQKHDTSFILNGKESRKGQARERKRERTDQMWEAEYSRERVAPWVITLGRWSSI